MLGTATTTVGYTEHVLGYNYVNSSRYFGFDTESDDSDETDWYEAQNNAYSNFRADTSLSRSSWSTGVAAYAYRHGRYVSDSYYGERVGVMSGGYFYWDISSITKSSIQYAGLRIAGNHHYVYTTGIWGFKAVNTGSVNFNITESVSTYSSGADIVDNFSSDFYVTYTDLNNAYVNDSRSFLFTPNTPNYIDIQFDENIVKNMSGNDLYLWYQHDYTNYPYRSEYPTNPTTSYELQFIVPTLLFIY